MQLPEWCQGCGACEASPQDLLACQEARAQADLEDERNAAEQDTGEDRYLEAMERGIAEAENPDSPLNNPYEREA